MKIKKMYSRERFIGREHELACLERYYGQSKANLVVLRGRRRIGKSRLVDFFSKDKSYYAFTGLPPEKGITDQHQRNEFSRKLAGYKVVWWIFFRRTRAIMPLLGFRPKKGSRISINAMSFHESLQDILPYLISK